MADQHLPWFPIYNDVTKFDGSRYRGVVDCVSGGFPCQGFSSASTSAKGLDDHRSELWFDMVRVVRQVRPRFVFVENSPRLARKGLYRITADLLSLGYHSIWSILGARHVGAPHDRDRLWLLAHTDNPGQRVRAIDEEMETPRTDSAGYASNPDGNRLVVGNTKEGDHQVGAQRTRRVWWTPASEPPRLDDGVACRVDRTRATGNGQVALCAAVAFRTLYSRIMA